MVPWRLEAKLREHRDVCERGMMEKSAVVGRVWENHHPVNWEETSVLDRARGQGEHTSSTYTFTLTLHITILYKFSIRYTFHAL